MVVVQIVNDMLPGETDVSQRCFVTKRKLLYRISTVTQNPGSFSYYDLNISAFDAYYSLSSPDDKLQTLASLRSPYCFLGMSESFFSLMSGTYTT